MPNRLLNGSAPFLLATFAMVFGSVDSAQAVSLAAQWEAPLRQANDQEVAAFMSHDVRGLSRLWAEDFLVTNPLNRVAVKEDVLAMVRDGSLSFKSYTRHIEQIRRYGVIAVIIGNEDVEWTGKMPLAGRPLSLRFTAVWIKSGPRWLEVARHANVIPKV